RIALETFERVRAEIAHITFELSESAWMNLNCIKSPQFDWTGAEKARIAAVGIRLGVGDYLDEVLHAIGEMDAHLSREFSRLREEAVSLKIALRSGLFANI